MYSYFDSSLLCAILFDESLFEEAWDIWNSSKARVSSILLKIETNVSLQRHYKTNAHSLDDNWLTKKEKILNSLLDDVFYKAIDESFGNVIAKDKTIIGCKSLDAIHIATALFFEKYSRDQKLAICSFDNNILAVAKQLGFETFG